MAPRRCTTLAIQMPHSKSERVSLSLRSFGAAISKLTTVILKTLKGWSRLYKLMQFDPEIASGLDADEASRGRMGNNSMKRRFRSWTEYLHFKTSVRLSTWINPMTWRLAIKAISALANPVVQANRAAATSAHQRKNWIGRSLITDPIIGMPRRL